MSSSSNLNAMLKNEIKNAVATLYDEQGTHAANRYSTPEELAKALLDLLWPEQAAHNTEITGVAVVPKAEAPPSDNESTDSKKARKPRAPMTEEAKAAMKAKREATIAAKKAAGEGAPAPAAPAAPAPAPPAEAPPSEGEGDAKKARKPRGPMTEEAKAQMKAKREATIAAKKAAQA